MSRGFCEDTQDGEMGQELLDQVLGGIGRWEIPTHIFGLWHENWLTTVLEFLSWRCFWKSVILLSGLVPSPLEDKRDAAMLLHKYSGSELRRSLTA